MAEQIWQKCKEGLKNKLGEISFDTWIAPLNLKKVTSASLILEAPDSFFKNWVESNPRGQKGFSAKEKKGQSKTFCMRDAALFIISLYKRFFPSHLFPSHCKYHPTCSEYAMQAFLRYDFYKALKISILRILRCNPFARGGFDSLR